MADLSKIRGIEGFTTSKIIAGNMYYFKYKAQTPDIVYDTYPLIFVTKRRGTLIEGINFHYFDIKTRMIIFDHLDPFFSTSSIESDTRLLVKSYRNLIMTSRKFRFAKITFHRYQLKRIRSQILRIPPTKWKTVIPMESEYFKTSAGKVIKSNIIFKESLLKSRGKL